MSVDLINLPNVFRPYDQWQEPDLVTRNKLFTATIAPPPRGRPFRSTQTAGPLGVLAFLAMLPLTLILRGVSIQLAWNWFLIRAVHVHEISFLTAIGVGFFVATFTIGRKSGYEDEAKQLTGWDAIRFAYKLILTAYGGFFVVALPLHWIIG